MNSLFMVAGLLVAAYVALLAVFLALRVLECAFVGLCAALQEFVRPFKGGAK